MDAPNHPNFIPVVALAHVANDRFIQRPTHCWHLDELSHEEHEVVFAAAAIVSARRKPLFAARLRHLFTHVLPGTVDQKMDLAGGLVREAIEINEAAAAQAAADAVPATAPASPPDFLAAPRPHGAHAPALDTLARWAARKACCPYCGRPRAHRLDTAVRVVVRVVERGGPRGSRGRDRTERALERGFRTFAARRGDSGRSRRFFFGSLII